MQQVKFYMIVIAMEMIACRPVAFMTMGVKQPKVENAQSIHDFLQTTKWQPGRHVISSYKGYMDNVSELGLTTIHIFSRDGRSLKMGSANRSACGPDPLPFIAGLDDKQPCELSADSLVLDSITHRLLLPDGTRFQYQRPDSVQFIAVITWAKWIGNKILNRDVTPCMQAVAGNKQVVFDVIVVNLDKQFVWGPENLEKVKLTRTGMEIR